MLELKSINRDFGYNLRMDSESGMITSEETRNIKSLINCSRYEDVDEREMSSIRSKIASIEHKESYEQAKEKLAYSNRKYRIAKCNKTSGNIIKIYEILKDISDEYPEFYIQAIKGCCQGTKKSYKGFRWHYVELDSDNLILKGMFDENNSASEKKLSYRYVKCDDSNNILKEYNNMSEILEEYPIFKERSIRNCCSGKTIRSGGFKWYYIDPYTNEILFNKK